MASGDPAPDRAHGPDYGSETPPGPASAPASETAAETSGTAPATGSGPADPAADARRRRVFEWLDARGIPYTWYAHPAAPTIDEARRFWRDDGSKHCKNLFFRNHKGDRHYLVCFDADRTLDIHALEKRLSQGKLTFASPRRMERYLGVLPGSVSPFGLVNDREHHVRLFLDRSLRASDSLSFHPNDNRATVVISRDAFLGYLAAVGNAYEFIDPFE